MTSVHRGHRRRVGNSTLEWASLTKMSSWLAENCTRCAAKRQSRGRKGEQLDAILNHHTTNEGAILYGVDVNHALLFEQRRFWSDYKLINVTRWLQNLPVHPTAIPATVQNIQSHVHTLERHKLETFWDPVIQFCLEHQSFPFDQGPCIMIVYICRLRLRQDGWRNITQESQNLCNFL